MTSVLPSLRDDLQAFEGYRSARSERLTGDIWLNANEASRSNGIDPDDALRRYPDPQPAALIKSLSELYGCAPDQLLIGRGSDETIDLLIRTFCRPGHDAILVCPPVFGMYAVCARLQGARVLEVPLVDGCADFSVDLSSVARQALAQGAKLVFLCSPGNPAGGLLASSGVLELARQLAGRALVVLDEAYVEYADAPSMVARVAMQPNLAVLRTLSKAHALAAVRIGCLIASPEVITALRRCQAPYPVPVPCADLAVRALAARPLARTRDNIRRTRIERALTKDTLAAVPGVRRVYPSQSNFLLVRFVAAGTAYRALLDAGVVVRDMRTMPQLADALRITIGTRQQNAVVLSALRSLAATSP